MKRNGFTLVEMLVVIAILSIFGALILIIFTRSLRGSNKAQIIGVIKQNGQSVLEQMDKTVRGADNIVCPRLGESCLRTTPPSCKTLMIKSGTGYTRYRFVDPSPSPSPTVNGLIQQDNPAPAATDTETTFINSVCPAASLSSSAITLTDTNNQTGISVFNGFFKIDKLSGYKDQVTIKFDVKPGVSAPAAVVGQIDPITFQTTIQLR